MRNPILAAVRYIAPAVLAVGTLLSAAPAFAGAIPDKLPSATPASRAMKAQATMGMHAFHASQRVTHTAPRAMARQYQHAMRTH